MALPLIVELVLFCLTLGYLVLILYLIRGWWQLPYYHNSQTNTSDHVYSIIIPARNEADNILKCLKDLDNQNFNAARFEVIVVDDHSEDTTAALVQDFMSKLTPQQPSIQLLTAKQVEDPSFQAYKKKAIETGIEHANGNWILTTDADCRRDVNWLRTLDAFIAHKKPCFVSGPVAFEENNTFLQKLQSLEFMGLIGIGAASMHNKQPNMCNGANLGYLKHVFYEVGGYTGVDHIASGDDELLMHKIAAQYPAQVQFIKNRNATVYTDPQPSTQALLQQRKRWVSKSRNYTRFSVSLVVYFVYLFHLTLFLTGIGWLMGWLDWFHFVIPLSAKVIPEFLFLLPVSRFFQKTRLLNYYPVAAIIYIIYVLWIGIYANMGTYYWKGRQVK